MQVFTLIVALCLYPVHGHVVNINDDVISVETNAGSIYDFYGNGYAVGEDLTLIIDGNNAVVDAR